MIKILSQNQMMTNELISFFKLDDTASDDLILHKIHLSFKRGVINNLFSNFLFEKFKETNDVRYFNELLWIDKNYIKIEDAKKIFFDNFIEKTYKFCYKSNMKNCLNLKASEVTVDYKYLMQKKIALIGNPLHFLLVMIKLNFLRIPFDMICIGYHPNKIMQFIFYNKITYCQ